MASPSSSAAFRRLNACYSCGRQYDVSHLSHGASVRCECGLRFQVRVQTPHSPKALCCSGCGAHVAVDARACAYCGAQVTLEERRLTAVCPKCFARTGRDARYCMECGVAISPQALFALEVGVSCPRCKGELHARGVAHGSVVECSRCGGLWLGHEDFVRVCSSAEKESLVEQFHQAQPTAPPSASDAARYVPCVVCREFMNRRNYASASGVIMDVCKAHGVWLDHGEIDKILAFIRGGGLERARRRQIERLEEQRRALEAERNAAAGHYSTRVERSESAVGDGALLGIELGAAFLDLLF